jgi:uncharacterized RDD family membrane protein YckC
VVDLIAITLIWGVAMAVIGSLAPGTESEDGGLAGLLGLLAIFVVPGAYLIPFEARSGMTPGKRVANLRVAALDGRPQLGPGGATVRYVWRFASLLPLGLGYLWAFGPRRRTWHDTLSGTAVVDSGATVIVEGAARPSARAAVRVVERRAPSPSPAPAAPAESPPPAHHGDPTSPRVLRSLAQTVLDRHHFDEAAMLLGAALRAEGDTEGREWCRVGLMLVDAGRAGDALAVVNRVLHANPNHAPAEAVQSLALLQLGGDSGGEAVAVARRAVLHAPSDPLAAVALAFALHLQGQHDEAEHVLDACPDLGEQICRAYLCRISIARRRGDRLGMERWARAAAELAPFDAELKVRVANALDPVLSAHHAGTRGLRIRMLFSTLRSLFSTTPSLAEQAGILVDALAAEPQNRNVREVLRTISTMGERRPVLHLSMVAGIVVFAAALLFSVVAMPWSAVFVGAVAVLGGAHTRTYLFQRGLLSPLAREWLAYVRRIHVIRRANMRAAKQNRSRPDVKSPAPPSSSVFAVPARCSCDGLNYLYGEAAIAYARMHLIEVRSHGAQLFELSCPTTLTPWLIFETTGSHGTDSPPVRLCRLSQVPNIPQRVNELPGQYL